MDILNKPISSFDFDAVVEFCKEGHIENIQIDYKKDLSEGLSKHFASFSNTRGGVILVGVEEDENTSAPLKFEGVANAGKLADRVHQFASNVEPTPGYEVHVTNTQAGKAFVLIRIFEGDRTPYYVQNNPNLYVRVGNTTKLVGKDLIGKASPDEASELHSRSEKAALQRETNLKQVASVFDASLARAERNRKKLYAEDKAQWKKEREQAKQPTDDSEYHSNVYGNELGSKDISAMASVVLQPYFPKRAIATPKEIKDSIMEVRTTVAGYDFPDLNVEPIPNGVRYFDWWKGSGDIFCQQVYSNGLLYLSNDILKADPSGDRNIGLFRIATLLLVVLRSATKLYSKFGYQGGLVGHLDVDISDEAYVRLIVPSNWRDDRDVLKTLLPYYRIDLQLDTSVLFSQKDLDAFVIDKIQELYWNFGYDGVSEEMIRVWLKEIGWPLDETGSGTAADSPPTS